MWRKRRKTCGHYDCKKRIRDDEFLCPEHYQGWIDGLIDRCPNCGRFKDVMYRLCLDCYVGRQVAPWEPSVPIPEPKQRYRTEYSEAWIDGYLRPDRFFIYILEFDDDELCVGHTTDIRKRLAEYEKPGLTRGRSPELQYLQIVATERAAELREAELKRLIESNPQQIRLMINDFRGHMGGLGLKQD